MLIKDKILEIMTADEGFISGEVLSEICHVSRTAIWKQIKNLQQAGYPIVAVHGQGYRLESAIDVFNKREIVKGLDLGGLYQEDKVYFLSEVDSTNSYAKKMALGGFSEGMVVVAEMQTGGKGRLGRSWSSQEGQGIWCSLILEPKVSILEASRFSFLIAVAVTEGIREVTGLEVKIKWPNDILLNEKKLCGILLELVAEVEQIQSLIVGFGINVNQTLEDFPKEIAKKATSLYLAGEKHWPRAYLLQKVLGFIEYYYKMYLEEGFSPIKEKWMAFSCIIGEVVSVVDFDREIAGGQVVGIDDDGALLLDCHGKVERVIAGDVSLRRRNQEYW